jgi:hypothetical protein
MPLPWLLAATTVIITKKIYDNFSDNDDGYDDDDTEEKAREKAKKIVKNKREKELALTKMKSWNSCIKAYISDVTIKKNFKISSTSAKTIKSKIRLFKTQIKKDNFVTEYEAYLEADNAIQELNKKIVAVDNVMGMFK